jgi:thiazole synthase
VSTGDRPHAGTGDRHAGGGGNGRDGHDADYSLHFYEALVHGATPDGAIAEAERRAAQPAIDDPLVIAGKSFRSRLLLGTGRYRSDDQLRAAIAASGAEIITVALRRLDLESKGPTLLDQIDWTRYTILPNTAGARTAEEAIQTARLARAMGLSDWVKLEVIPDPAYLLPDPIGTLEAAKVLVAEGFVVLPYIGADPVLAKRLEEVGTATVMPLGSPIGSGQGLVNLEAIKIIVEQASVPVVVDAGIGAPSDAALALELGADAVLVNTAVAQAVRPALMAEAFRFAVEAGRKGCRAGRIAKRPYAMASSPAVGIAKP